LLDKGKEKRRGEERARLPRVYRENRALPAR
jgi:hypothetical protein